MRTKESGPIVGRQGIQDGDDVFEFIGFQPGDVGRASVENLAEIVQGFFVFGKAAQSAVDIEPEQLAFFVKISATAPIRPVLGGVVEERSSIGGILQVAPIASGTMFIRSDKLG